MVELAEVGSSMMKEDMLLEESVEEAGDKEWCLPCCACAILLWLR